MLKKIDFKMDIFCSLKSNVKKKIIGTKLILKHNMCILIH